MLAIETYLFTFQIDETYSVPDQDRQEMLDLVTKSLKGGDHS